MFKTVSVYELNWDLFRGPVNFISSLPTCIVFVDLKEKKDEKKNTPAKSLYAVER